MTKVFSFQARTKARHGIWMCRWVGETLSHSSKHWKVNKRSPAHLECHLTGSHLTCQTFSGWNYWRAPRQEGSKLDFWCRYVCARTISGVWGRDWADLLTSPAFPSLSEASPERNVWSRHHWGDATGRAIQRMLGGAFYRCCLSGCQLHLCVASNVCAGYCK